MLQDFNIQNTLENIRVSQKINKEHERIANNLNQTSLEYYSKTAQKRKLEESNSTALVIKSDINIFSKFASLFHRGRYYAIKQQLKKNEKDLKDLEIQCRKLEYEVNHLQACEKMLRMEIQAKSIPSFFVEENGNLIITDKFFGTIYSVVEQDFEKFSDEEKVIVYCTDNLPINNTITRSEAYFTINCMADTKPKVNDDVVEESENDDNVAENIYNPNYIIVDRYDVHKDELETNLIEASVMGESFTFSDDAVILVNIEQRNNLPISNDNFEEKRIIFYNGNPTTCLRNFLRFNNYQIFQNIKKEEMLKNE